MTDVLPFHHALVARAGADAQLEPLRATGHTEAACLSSYGSHVAEGVSLLAAVLLAVVAGAVLGLSMTNGRDGQAFADSVVLVRWWSGRSERAAIAAIANAGLKPEIEYRRMHTAKRGVTRRVIAQGPVARVTSKGQPVTLVVAIATARHG